MGWLLPCFLSIHWGRKSFIFSTRDSRCFDVILGPAVREGERQREPTLALWCDEGKETFPFHWTKGVGDGRVRKFHWIERRWEGSDEVRNIWLWDILAWELSSWVFPSIEKHVVEYTKVYFIASTRQTEEGQKGGETIRLWLKGVKKYDNLMHTIQYQLTISRTIHFAPQTATDKRPRALVFKSKYKK